MKPHQIWLEQCEAAREIAAEFGLTAPPDTQPCRAA